MTVKELQKILGVTADGIIGKNTLSAIEVKLGITSSIVSDIERIKKIQNHVGTVADGIIGGKTISAIVSKMSSPKKAAVAKTNKLVCISIGHSSKDEGAWTADKKVGEYSYNKELASMIQDELSDLGIQSVITNRLTNGGGTGVSADIRAINSTKASIVIELHANAFNGKATGTETLYWHSSQNGKKLAELVQEECVNALGLTNRGLKALTSSSRGGGILNKVTPVAIITEPFFIDTPSDFVSAVANKKKLAKGISNAINKYFS